VRADSPARVFVFFVTRVAHRELSIIIPDPAHHRPRNGTWSANGRPDNLRSMSLIVPGNPQLNLNAETFPLVKGNGRITLRKLFPRRFVRCVFRDFLRSYSSLIETRKE